MEVWSCVPRVPWNVFCCLVCKNIADTTDFWWDDDFEKKTLVQIFIPTTPWEGGINNKVPEKSVGEQNMIFRTHKNRTKSKR